MGRHKLTAEQKEAMKAEKIAKEKREAEIKKKAEELMKNDSDVIQKIEDLFESKKQDVADIILNEIRDIYADRPLHYKWKRSSIPWDSSKKLVEDGMISDNITLLEFLEEYTGCWRPTYESKQGWIYENYDDEISYETLEAGEKIMAEVLQKYIPDNCSRDEIWYFNDLIHDHFYDETPASRFFTTLGTINYLGKDILDPYRTIHELLDEFEGRKNAAHS